MTSATHARGPLRRLLGSSKALVVLVVVTLSFIALFSGRATWADVSSLLKYVIGPWLAAVGLEDAARNLGDPGGQRLQASGFRLQQEEKKQEEKTS